MFKCKKCGKKISGDSDVYDILIEGELVDLRLKAVEKEVSDSTMDSKTYVGETLIGKVIKKYNVLLDEILLDNNVLIKRDIKLEGKPSVERIEGVIKIYEKIEPICKRDKNKIIYRCPYCGSKLMEVSK